MTLSSMTGFGRAEEVIGLTQIICEIRGVNSRYLETNCKIPNELYQYEIPIKKLVSKFVNRGKVDIAISIKQDTLQTTVNTELLNQNVKANIDELWQEFKSLGLSESNKEKFLINILPILNSNILSKKEPTVETKLSLNEELITSVVEKALTSFMKTKETEGAGLTKTLVLLKDEVTTIFINIKKALINYPAVQKTRLQNFYNELIGMSLSEDKLIQELATLSMKSDISEEVARVEVHLNELNSILNSSKNVSVGKRLDVLLQEFNREFTTIASKAQGLEIVPYTIDARVAIEKIREQIQNIE